MDAVDSGSSEHGVRRCGRIFPHQVRSVRPRYSHIFVALFWRNERTHSGLPCTLLTSLLACPYLIHLISLPGMRRRTELWLLYPHKLELGPLASSRTTAGFARSQVEIKPRLDIAIHMGIRNLQAGRHPRRTPANTRRATIPSTRG